MKAECPGDVYRAEFNPLTAARPVRLSAPGRPSVKPRSAVRDTAELQENRPVRPGPAWSGARAPVAAVGQFGLSPWVRVSQATKRLLLPAGRFCSVRVWVLVMATPRRLCRAL